MAIRIIEPNMGPAYIKTFPYLQAKQNRLCHNAEPIIRNIEPIVTGQAGQQHTIIWSALKKFGII
jgi:hypothetical protein